MDFNRYEINKETFKLDKFYEEKKQQRQAISGNKKQWRREHWKLITAVIAVCVVVLGVCIGTHLLG